MPLALLIKKEGDMKRKINFKIFLLLTVIITFFVFWGFSKSFTLEDILSTPFPSHLIVAQKVDRVAWVFNEQGKRNIWVADGPDYKARRITAYNEDNGQEISNLHFTPDGKIIVYVLGGSPNRKGEYPNPTSNPKGVERAVWAVKVDGGKPWRIGEGTNPQISPKGDFVIFSNRGNILIAPIDGSEKPKILFKARGSNRFYKWSPDGSKIAFVSYREDHSFIGIYDLKKETISWLAPDVERDNYPVWSPDGKYIAFIRFPGAKVDGYSYWKSAGVPFSIWVVNIETGKGREIWKTSKGGGFAQYYPAHPLVWAGNEYLIFYSEHEGWMHLYSLSVKDGKITCLTPGEYEVEDMTLTPDGKTVIFNSNKNDIDRRHLWVVPVKGGKIKPLTSGKGIEWSPIVPPSGKNIIFFCSTAYQPASPAMIDIKGGKPKLIAPETIPQNFPLKDLVEPKQVIFKAPDGLKIHAQLFLPKDAKPGDRRPAVIFMHGGPIRQMLLGWHYRGYYHNAYAFNQYLANKGYVVLSVNYRSGIGYGQAFRNAPNQGPRGASEYQDIVAAAKYLQKRPEVDPLKIGLWGGSYGGYLTALGLARDSDLFAAGVDFHGVHDWSLRGRRRDGGGWGLRGEELMRKAYDSSPVADIDFWTSPCLFIHGDDDRNVDFIQTTDLVQRLKELGKAHIETLIFPDEVHGFLLHRSWLRAYQAAADFFDRFLKGKK